MTITKIWPKSVIPNILEQTKKLRQEVVFFREGLFGNEGISK